MASMHELEEVYFANLRDHQIGETKGMTPEVAADLGFLTAQDTLRLIASTPTPVQETQPKPRKLTIQEQNDNERRIIEEHLGTVSKQQLDPDFLRYYSRRRH